MRLVSSLFACLLYRCLHCHNLVPLYTRAARMLLPHNIPLARVNIENAMDTAKRCVCECADRQTDSHAHTYITRYHVGEVPQLRIFRRGLVFPYEGPGEESGAQGEPITLPDHSHVTWDEPITSPDHSHVTWNEPIISPDLNHVTWSLMHSHVTWNEPIISPDLNHVTWSLMHSQSLWLLNQQQFVFV